MKSLKVEQRRKLENDALLEKMRSGKSLAMVNTQATWWPPRPMIKKDAGALDILFKKD